MDKSVTQALEPASPAGLDRHMPMPPVCNSDLAFPLLTSMRICLYRLPPCRITIPPGQTMRIVVQLSSRSMHLERGMNGITSVAQPSLDAININPAFQAIKWQWDNFLEFVQIQITPEFLLRMQDAYGVDAGRIMQLERFSVHDAMIAQCAHELADLLEDRHPKVETLYLDKMAEFLVLHLWNRYCLPPAAKAAEKLHGPDFHRIVDFIHENLDKDLRLDQIARMANLSNFYFIRLFKTNFGKTPHQYILECRIGLAKQLLRDTFLPISDISQRCGFSTQSHFTSAFRQATEQSPRSYRQSLAKKPQAGH